MQIHRVKYLVQTFFLFIPALPVDSVNPFTQMGNAKALSRKNNKYNLKLDYEKGLIWLNLQCFTEGEPPSSKN